MFVDASLEAATFLLPPYLAGAIKKQPDVKDECIVIPAISMQFFTADDDSIRCQMTLEITENKVHYLAREMFDAHMETTSGLQYLCLPGGAKVLPNPSLTLQACRSSVISRIFGQDISSAITASLAYRSDIKLGRDDTDCVSMVVSHRAHDGAFIYMALDPRKGYSIRDKLYK